MARWCADCGKACRGTTCDDCRRDELRQRQLDELDLELIELLDDCG